MPKPDKFKPEREYEAPELFDESKLFVKKKLIKHVASVERMRRSFSRLDV